jgi:hypothetical protein
VQMVMLAQSPEWEKIYDKNKMVILERKSTLKE